MQRSLDSYIHPLSNDKPTRRRGTLDNVNGRGSEVGPSSSTICLMAVGMEKVLRLAKQFN